MRLIAKIITEPIWLIVCSDFLQGYSLRLYPFFLLKFECRNILEAINKSF